MTSKKLFLLIISIFIVLPLFAQPGRGRAQLDQQMEVIEARRIAFLTEKMSLSPREAKVFWPIHNEYTTKVEALHKAYRDFHTTMPEVNQMTEEQALIYIDKELERMEKAAALRREYQDKFLEVLSAKKIAMLYEAERNFNRMLFRESQQRHQRERRK